MIDKITDRLNILEDLLINKCEIDLELFQKVIKETQAIRELVLTIPVVVGQSEQLKCDCCNGTGLVEGEHYDDIQGCLTCNGRGTF